MKRVPPQTRPRLYLTAEDFTRIRDAVMLDTYPAAPAWCVEVEHD